MSEYDKQATNFLERFGCLSSESQNPPDPDEVYAEFGNMKPSQARDIATFAKLIQTFFRDDELRQLREIQ